MSGPGAVQDRERAALETRRVRIDMQVRLLDQRAMLCALLSAITVGVAIQVDHVSTPMPTGSGGAAPMVTR